MLWCIRKLIRIFCRPVTEDINHRRMQNYVKTLKGELLTLNVHCSDSICSVKAKVEDKICIPPEKQILRFAGIRTSPQL